jgi:hypothetical protein
MKMSSARSRHVLFRTMQFLLIALLSSPALGFTCSRRHRVTMIASSSRPTKKSFPNGQSSLPLFMSRTNEFNLTRADFLSKSIIGYYAVCFSVVANAFDGGVGGLGMSILQSWSSLVVPLSLLDVRNNVQDGTPCLDLRIPREN